MKSSKPLGKTEGGEMHGEEKSRRSCPKLHSKWQEKDPIALNKYKGLCVVSQYVVLSLPLVKEEWVGV